MSPKLIIISSVTVLALGGGFLLLQSPQDAEGATITSPDAITPPSVSVTEESSTDRAVSVSSESSPSVDSEKKAKRKKSRKKKSKPQQNMVNKMISDKSAADTEQKRRALEARLNLSPEQATALQGYYDKNNEILKNVHNEMLKNMYQSGKKADDGRKKLADAITEAGLADYMEEHLTEDQQAALASYQQEQSDNQADKLTLKELSAVIGVTGMSDEQRQAVYDILNADVVTELDSQSDQQILDAHISSMFGMEDESLSGMVEYVGIMKKLEEAGKSPDEIIEVINAKQEVVLEQKVQRLSEVLDAPQLESYRDYLQEKIDAMSDLMKMSDKTSQ